MCGLTVGLLVLGRAGLENAWAQQASGPPASQPCRESVPDLYKRMSPTVVSIAATSISLYDIDHRMDRVAGSGVIVDASGLVLTNSHVVFGRQIITVTLDDGTTLPAQLVGADPLFDIAVIRIPRPPEGTLPVARLGNSEHLLVGQEVYAIGNPFGLEQTLTRGIVSAVNRLLPGGSLPVREPLIQTDTAINPGSSGGPLIDACGDIVGITTALLENAQGIGFAIPSDLAKDVMPQLVKDGRVIRPWLGVQGQPVVPILKDFFRVPLVDGFLVEVVEPGSPADRVGLHGGELEVTIAGQSILLGGDIITAVNGMPITDSDKLAAVLESLQVGATLHLAVVRETKTREVEVTLSERPLLPWDLPAKRAAAPAAAGVSRSLGRLAAGRVWVF